MKGEKECLKLKITNQHYSVGYDAKTFIIYCTIFEVLDTGSGYFYLFCG